MIIIVMIIIILTTIKFKIKTTVRKVHFNRNEKPIKLSVPLKILGYLIYFSAILFVLFLIVLIGPWVWYYIEMHY